MQPSKIEDRIFSFVFFVTCFSLTYGLWFYHREFPIPYGPSSEFLIIIFAIMFAPIASIIDQLVSWIVDGILTLIKRDVQKINGTSSNSLVLTFAVICTLVLRTINWFTNNLPIINWWSVQKAIVFGTTLAILLSLPIKIQILSFDYWMAGIGLPITFFISCMYKAEEKAEITKTGV
ncbi:MAG: hypothetical protein KAR54_00775 [Candidatus Pacebacteria bacterium]|nr:hypothetical protein [Candidatus Paceibacterota bacterium]